MTRSPIPEVSPPASGLRRYRMVVAYDGSAYRGFAANAGVETVEATLSAALRKLLGHEIRLTCAGRTDAGVHGRGQVVSFDAAPIGDPARFRRSMNALCGPDVVVRSVEVAADDFDARFSARSRTYRYRVLNADVPDPVLRRTSWHVSDRLDVEAMQRAGDHLVGVHDFSSFCRRRMVAVGGEEIAASLVREVIGVEWRPASTAPTAGARDAPAGGGDELGEIVDLWITATAFCHQMVRSVTGTMVDVGRGRRSPDDMPAILAARDRAAAGTVAPPQGLTLWHVAY